MGQEARSAATTEPRWLQRSRWLRHHILIPLVGVAAVVWIVRQVTA